MKVFVFLLFALIALTSLAEAKKKKIVCYYESWIVYEKHYKKVEPEDLDLGLCTHLLYSFVGVKKDGSLHLNDKWLELPDDGGLDLLRRFNDLKKKNNDLKTMVSIGGWDEGSKKFSEIANDKETRKTFAKNVVKFIEKYGFDGMDLDWEYPTARGGQDSDKKAFSKLLKQLRKHFDDKGYILSAAVSADPGQTDDSYDVPKLDKYLDFINLMTYDYRGSDDDEIGHNAPLYASSSESKDKHKQTVSETVKHWIKSGASPEKLMLGIPFYGTSFKLKHKSKTYPGAPSDGPGVGHGTVGFNEICHNLNKDWTQVWDDEQQVPHAYKGHDWIGYDDTRSVEVKTQYAIDNGLGGAMVWAIDMDDAHGDCGLPGGAFPLVKTIKKTFEKGSIKNGV